MISQEIVSSNIEHAGHHRGDLYIRFKSGITYKYDKVPLKVYQEMVAAESAGHYFHTDIRGKYNYTKLEHDPFKPAAAAA